jgi:hypothetical protein
MFGAFKALFFSACIVVIVVAVWLASNEWQDLGQPTPTSITNER